MEIKVNRKKDNLYFIKNNSNIKYKFSERTGQFSQFKNGEWNNFMDKTTVNSWFRNCSIKIEDEQLKRTLVAGVLTSDKKRISFPTLLQDIRNRDYTIKIIEEWEAIGIRFQEISEYLEEGIDLSNIQHARYYYIKERPKYIDKNVKKWILDYQKEHPLSFDHLNSLIGKDIKDLQILKELMDAEKENPEIFQIKKIGYRPQQSIFDSDFDCNRLIEVIKLYNINIDRFCQYLTQLKYWEHTDMTWVVHNYKDYLDAEYELNNQRKSKMDKYPSNLVQAHHVKTHMVQELRAEKRRLEEKEQARKDEVIYQSFRDTFEYVNPKEKYCIIAPKDANEVIEEGVKQSHCVGMYTNRISERKVAILFMRSTKNPQKPLLTIDINLKGPSMRQALGKHNRLATKEERKFLEDYCDKYHIQYAAYQRLL